QQGLGVFTEQEALQAIGFCVRRGRTDLAGLLVKYGAIRPDTAGEEAPLAAAVNGTWAGHPGIVKLLLDAGFDARHASPSGSTVLHRAALQGDLETLSLLLDAGADPVAVDNKGVTPAHCAAIQGNPEIV
ncbi:ankyrin repeat domain-containing protein, partial [Candidatus Bathyarchaeota archaeon]|nr:ankyrin repeat domain-containing protein [Candidatus Bathyarchaeota archaeon]